MADQLIYKKLKSKALQKLADDVKAYLASVNNNPQKCADFIKTLFTYILKVQNGNASHEVHAEALAAIDIGLQTLQEVLQLTDCSDHLNTLYHVFALLLKQALFTQASMATQIVLSLLKTMDCQNPKTTVVISNMYVQLWNTALEIRQTNEEAQQAIGLELLLHAMRLLCLKDELSVVADKHIIAATWCAVKVKNERWLKELRQCVVTSVSMLLARVPAQLRANIPATITILLDQHKLSLRFGKCFSLVSEWKKTVSEALFAHEMGLYRHVTALLTIVDQVSAFGQCIAGRISSVPQVKPPTCIRWQDCRPGTEEFTCLTSCVQTIFARLHAADQQIQGAADRQKFTAAFREMLSLAPFVKQHVSHLHSVKAGLEFTLMALRVLKLLLIQLTYLIQDTKDEKQFLKTLTAAEDYCPSSLVEIAETCAMKTVDIGLLARPFYLLAYNCFQNKASKHAITYAKISVELTALHMTYHPEDISAETQNEFWKRCELLLWQFRQEKRYMEALHIIGKLVTLGVEMRSLALIRWVKIKKETSATQEFQGSLLKQLEMVGSPLQMTAEDKFGFLSFELNLSIREGLPAGTCVDLYYELKKLVLEINNEFTNTYYLVESTVLLSRFPYIDFNLDCTFDESFEKALTSVEALLKTNDKETTDTARLLHAACLFWLYMNKINTLRDFAAKEDVTEAAVDPSEIKCDDPILRQALAEDKDYSCDAARNYRHINVGYELSTQKDLDQVLELWCIAFQSPSSEWSLHFRDLVECWFFEHVKVVSEVFASSFRFLDEVKAVTLWYSVAKDRGMNQETVLAASYLINALIKVGLVEAAATVSEQTEAVACQLGEGLPRLRFVLAQAHLLYSQEKFTQGFVLLEELLKHPLLQKNNKSSLLFMAEVKLLVCQYSLLPAAITGPLRAKGLLECDTPILLAQESLKMSQGVLHHFTDNITVEPCDPVTMWTLERVLLDSAALLGQLYTGVGAAKEAYTFLKEYLRKAQMLVSATRCARLVLLIANLDLLCEKLHDAKRKLVSVEFMLHLGNFSCPKRPHNKEGSAMGLHSEDSGEILEKTYDKYPLPTIRSHSMSVVLFLKREATLHSPPSIPSLDNIHSANCDCQLCKFYATKQLWIERDLLKCLLYVTVGDVAAAISGFESLLTLTDSLQQKLLQEVAAVTTFLKHRLSKAMCFSLNKTAGSWAELLSLRASILLQLSEAHLLRKSYSSSLERADEGLKLVSLNGCGGKSHWKAFASLAHQKVLVLVTMSRKARDCSGNLKDSSLWLVNTNQHAAVTMDEPAQSSPQRQHEKRSTILKVPNAPKPRRDTPMDRYIKSLSRAEAASCADRGREEKAAFVVYDETVESSMGGAKHSVARASRRGTRTRAAADATAAAAAAAAGDTVRSRHADGKPEVSRMPKKQVRAQRKTAKTDLVSTNAAEGTATLGGGEDPVEQVQARCANDVSAQLNTVDEEEAAASVARLSLLEREPTVQEDVLYMQKEEVMVKEEQFTACRPQAYGEMMALLDKAFQLIVHFPPCPLYAEMSRTMAHLLDLQEMSTKDSKDACLWHVSQTSAITLQHVGLTCLYKKIKKQKAAFIRDGVQEWKLNEQDLSKAQALEFRTLSELKTVQLTELYELLPADWTVVQVTAAEPVTKGPSGVTLTPDLFVCQCRQGKAPITVKLSGSSDAEFQRVLFKEFNTILDESTATMKMTEPPIWWSVRHSLDKRMKDVVESMENTWMGCWKGVFHGKIVDAGAYKDLKDSVAQVLAKATKSKLECCSNRLLEAVIDSAADLSSYQLSVAVCQLFGISSSHPAHRILSNLIQSKANLDFDIRRHPVILILDKLVQALPWESTPILLKNSVSRVPSINYLHAQLLHYHLMTENVYSQHVDTQNTYFILNPTNDIPRTQAQFEGIFSSLGWQGVIGKPPHKEEFQAALVSKDLVVYCGHGSGREYLVSDVIEQMHCHACPILMGCGSGRLKAFGPKIEPFGVVLQYWVGGSPCAVANLWDVTDKDIDRFTETFLRHWIPGLGSEDYIPDISTAVRLSRKSCKLQYLVGAAPVVYGLPVQSKKAPST